jgi:hypothetical protein
MSDNMNGYHGAYETMITACTAALIMPVAGYDLYKCLAQMKASHSSRNSLDCQQAMEPTPHNSHEGLKSLSSRG